MACRCTIACCGTMARCGTIACCGTMAWRGRWHKDPMEANVLRLRASPDVRNLNPFLCPYPAAMQIQTFWHFGILTFWHFDIFAFWHFGILAFLHYCIMIFWHFGILAFWHFGILALRVLRSSSGWDGGRRWETASGTTAMTAQREGYIEDRAEGTHRRTSPNKQKTVMTVIPVIP